MVSVCTGMQTLRSGRERNLQDWVLWNSTISNPSPWQHAKKQTSSHPQPLQCFNPRVFSFNLEHNEILSRSLIPKGRFPIRRLSPVAQNHSSFLFWIQGCVLNLDWATRDLGKWKQQGPVKPARWHKISVQIPVIPPVKGLHYALRI